MAGFLNVKAWLEREGEKRKSMINWCINDHKCKSFLEEASSRIVGVLKKGGTVFAAGNGGSAADAIHFVGELVGRYKKERPPFRAIALGTNLSVLTALSNDYGYAVALARELEGLAKEGDVLVVFTTSGNSENIINAVNVAKRKGLFTIALLGKGGGKLKGQCDVEIIIPSDETPVIQEMHHFLYHLLSERVEALMTEDGERRGQD